MAFGRREVVSTNPDHTEWMGRWLGERIGPGVVLELRGELGAGKTCFVRGVAAGIGVTDPVQSPTFVICNAYAGGRCPLYHVDAYRLEDPDDLLLYGWDDMRERGVIIVEWGDRLGRLLPADRLTVLLEHRDEQTRLLEFRARGEFSNELLASLP